MLSNIQILEHGQHYTTDLTILNTEGFGRYSWEC
jgi:hypothetical protein